MSLIMILGFFQDIAFKGGGKNEYRDFNAALRRLSHPVKVVICGNHDW
jgi:hypothetical protein